MLAFCVLWVLVDSREACFFTYVYGESGSVWAWVSIG